MKLLLLLLIILYFLNESKCTVGKVKKNLKLHSPLRGVNEEALLTTPELAVKHNYPLEIHATTTEDGYVIQLHRIRYGKSGPSPNRPIVFLMHGMFSASSHWLLTGPEKSLGYILADAGYDVWMGNARGNRYSRKNIHYDPDKDRKKFWNFSWHEIGKFDLPATIEHIKNSTNQTKIFYIGHSQGTTAFYVMASERPEYNKNIIAQFSLAPIAFVKGVRTPYRAINVFLKLFSLNSKHEIYRHNALYRKRAAHFCDDRSLLYYPCMNYLFLYYGYDPKQINSSVLSVYIGHSYEGAALKQLIHFGQEMKSGKFRQYDLGLTGNLKQYHRLKPPSYDLSKITAPVYLYHAKNDLLSTERDVEKLHKKLKNSTKILMENDKFNHIDFMIGESAPKVVYKPILEEMNRYNCINKNKNCK